MVLKEVAAVDETYAFRVGTSLSGKISDYSAYSILYKLEEMGLVVSEKEPRREGVAGTGRRFYKITEAGRSFLEEESKKVPSKNSKTDSTTLSREEKTFYRDLVVSLLKEIPAERVIYRPLDGKVGGYTAGELRGFTEGSETEEVAYQWATDVMRVARNMVARVRTGK